MLGTHNEPNAPSNNSPITIIAFDFGVKKIGVAIGNTLTNVARPLQILQSETRELRFKLVSDVLNQWQPDMAIVGLPLTTDGQEQYTTLQAKRFANQLRGRYGLRVEMVDERRSSLEAQEVLGTNEPDDAMAATIVLQRYLDSF